jgi:uncharacterized protein DUF6503
MKRKLFGPAAVFAGFWLAVAHMHGASAPDAKANEIADAMVAAMGGMEAWNKAHFVRFDFKVTSGGKTVVDRSHLWDKMTGRYRFEGKTKDGKPYVTMFNIASRQGSAYLSGKKLEGTPAAEAMTNAYSAFINDMYWLAMPWKWRDAGVHLKYAGKKTRGAASYDVVELTFDQVGLTPGDRYEAYVSPKSHLMEHWEYKLQSGQTGSWDWQYTTTGGVKLAANHTSADGKSINMGKVSIAASVDDAVFSDPAKSMP